MQSFLDRSVQCNGGQTDSAEGMMQTVPCEKTHILRGGMAIKPSNRGEAPWQTERFISFYQSLL